MKIRESECNALACLWARRAAEKGGSLDRLDPSLLQDFLRDMQFDLSRRELVLLRYRMTVNGSISLRIFLFWWIDGTLPPMNEGQKGGDATANCVSEDRSTSNEKKGEAPAEEGGSSSFYTSQM